MKKFIILVICCLLSGNFVLAQNNIKVTSKPIIKRSVAKNVAAKVNKNTKPKQINIKKTNTEIAKLKTVKKNKTVKSNSALKQDNKLKQQHVVKPSIQLKKSVSSKPKQNNTVKPIINTQSNNSFKPSSVKTNTIRMQKSVINKSKPVVKKVQPAKTVVKTMQEDNVNSEIKKVEDTNVENTKKIHKFRLKKIKIDNPFKKTVKQPEETISPEEYQNVKDLTQQAVALYTDNNIEESLKAFLKIPDQYRSAGDYVLIGNILQDMQRVDDAIFMYKRAILVDETNYKAYYNLGTICLDNDKFYMSIDYFKNAIKYNPKFAYSYYNLGCAYIKTGQLKKAKNELDRAIELKNTEPDFHYNLAYVYKKLNKPKLAKIYLNNYNKLTNGD